MSEQDAEKEITGRKRTSRAASYAGWLTLISWAVLLAGLIIYFLTPFDSICNFQSYVGKHRLLGHFLIWIRATGGLLMILAPIIAILGFIMGFIGLFIILFSIARLSGTYRAVFTMISCVLILGLIILSIVSRIEYISKQAEAKANLGFLYFAEKEYFYKNGKYIASFNDINGETVGHTRYSYFLNPEVVIIAKYPDHFPCKRLENECDPHTDIRPFVNDKSFLAMAVSNNDQDKVLDVWTVDDKKQLKNIHNDAICDSWQEVEDPYLWRQYLKAVLGLEGFTDLFYFH